MDADCNILACVGELDPIYHQHYAAGLKGANAVLNACASALSSSSGSMHAFQSSLSGVPSRVTNACLNRGKQVSHGYQTTE